jgi:hypothetical protein
MKSKQVYIRELAHARSGDKGDLVNIALIAHDEHAFGLLKQGITTEILKTWFEGWTEGPFEIYSIESILSLNCVIHNVLQGGGTTSRRLDAQGKALGQALLQAWIEVPIES